jgi:hypothetical protein
MERARTWSGLEKRLGRHGGDVKTLVAKLLLI